MENNLISNLMNSSYKNLSDIFRYSRTRVIQKENLAEHSYYVTLISDIIAEDISSKHDVNINREKILRFALYHDFEEWITWDIITPVKKSSKVFKKELEKIWESLLKESIEREFIWYKHIQRLILSSHQNYEKFKNIDLENKIVKFSDIIQALLYSYIEYNTWNKFFKNIINDIKLELNRLYSKDLYFKDYLYEINNQELNFKN